MGYLGKIKDTAGNVHLIGSTLYGTCSTPAATEEKVVTCADFNTSTIPTGLTIHVKFTYGNTTSTAALKVGSSNAIGIKRPSTGDLGTPETSWNDGDMVTFTYDGTNWCMNESKTGIDSTKLPLAGGAMSGDIQLNNNRIYFGGSTEGAYLQKDTVNSCVDIIYESGQVEIANTGVEISCAGGGISLKPGTNQSVDVSGSLTATTTTTALKSCTLNTALDAVSQSIYFGPNDSTRGTIGYSSGLKLQYQGSSITLSSSTITMSCPAWPIGTGNKVYINGTTLSKESSSKRYKDDIIYDLDKEKLHSILMKMKPCQFHYKTEPDLNQYGFIAEDLEELDSKLCIHEDDKVENYLDRGIMAIVVSELQRKDEEIKELKARIEKLENKGG